MQDEQDVLHLLVPKTLKGFNQLKDELDFEAQGSQVLQGAAPQGSHSDLAIGIPSVIALNAFSQGI